MSKKVKALEIEALRKSFAGVKDYVVVEPLKVDAAADLEFRRKLRAKKIRAQVVKNTYGQRVFTEMGIAVDVWAGPTLLCWGGANIKELSNTVDEQVKASKKDPKSPEKYKIKTAIADGEALPIEEAKVRPTREEAIGNIVAALMGPGSEIVAALTGPAAQLAGIVKAIEEKGPKEGESAPEKAVSNEL
ncbi:MAG TPA: 50S ribosomal protein L10 [Fimbriiglobus sp.]|nr:50S ribosomal protein L10 [Fimbriiglobus sp.]